MIVPPPTQATSTHTWNGLAAPAVFAALVLAMFMDVLFSGTRVLSSSTTDLALQFIPWREFGFEQLRGGNLAMWNPHIFGGTPYFAGFQAALLYPPNWLHLLLPLPVAINLIIALHVFAAGYFTYLWVRFHGISIPGGILAGAIFMFSGPYFLHIYAGHLPHLCVMVWAPLILLGIDGLARDGSVRWALFGALAIAMQILAGHPQYVYYTGIAATLYATMRLHRRNGARLTVGFVTIYALGAALAAVQLLPGIDLNRETVRGTRTAYEFASTFSLAPPNLLTLVVPNFFGSVRMDDATVPLALYWGPGYYWELCIFMGACAAALAAYGAIAARIPGKWAIVVMVIITLLLALGRHTPLYRLMYDYLPSYAAFRGTVKFSYLTVLFAAWLAGAGFDVLKRRRPGWILLALIAGMSVCALLGAWWINSSSAGGADAAWGRWLASMAETYSAQKELFTARVESFQQATFVSAAGAGAARALSWTSGVMGALLLVLFAARFRAILLYGVLVLCLCELFFFARSTRATMDPAAARQLFPAWRDHLPPANQRLLTISARFANLGMSLGYSNLSGYDPGVLRRYAELIHASQGADPDEATQYLPFRRPISGIFRMLRCAAVFFDPNAPPLPIADPLPEAGIVGYWVILPSRDAQLAYLMREDFDPRFAVVLESEPAIPAGAASAAGASVEVLSSTTDTLEVRAHVAHPAILLITNNFARGWRVRSLQTTASQPKYRLMPANYTLQAIPLMPGSHHLMLEYAPRAFAIGRWISILAAILFAGIGMRQSLRHAANFLLMHARARFR